MDFGVNTSTAPGFAREEPFFHADYADSNVRRERLAYITSRHV